MRKFLYAYSYFLMRTRKVSLHTSLDYYNGIDVIAKFFENVHFFVLFCILETDTDTIENLLGAYSNSYVKLYHPYSDTQQNQKIFSGYGLVQHNS
jgi:hypothetical protein